MAIVEQNRLVWGKGGGGGGGGGGSADMYLRKQVPISLCLFQGLQLIAQDFETHGSHCRILWLDSPPQVRQNSVRRPDAIEACMSSFSL